MGVFFRVAVGVAVLASAATIRAEEAYYRVAIRDLTITEGALPKVRDVKPTRAAVDRSAMRPRVVLDKSGESYFRLEQGRFSRWMQLSEVLDRGRVYLRAPKGQDVTGQLFVPNSDWSGMVALKFRVPHTSARTDLKKEFLEAKRAHYEELLARNVPGAAWFRHQRRVIQRTLDPKDADHPAAGAPLRMRPNDLTRTYALFSGGRAMSENLQLDRALPTDRDDQATELQEKVPLKSIRGITVEEIDWSKLIKDQQPDPDPLAAKIPADQHVVFFPSFQAAATVADEAAKHGTPVLRLAEPRSENARTVERYERQLGVSLDGAARLLGPKLVDGIALTGSDPYYRTGTDVAVLLETKQPGVLAGLLLAQIASVTPVTGRAEIVRGDVNDLQYQGRCSPDRSVSSYVATLDGAVVVTNSLHQLKRLAAVKRGDTPSIATLPEYRFFRIRYPRADKEETTLLVLSDATIRRWCGPRWRIATSRRIRDAAVLAEMQASQLDPLVRGKVVPGAIHTDLPIADDATLTLDTSGVASSVHGTLHFMTPIAEIPMTEVTKAEAEAYRRWRDGYERNWTAAFDPIALRLHLQEDRLGADLTVMPLIVGTRYRQFIAISRDAKMTPEAGDPHDALAHFALAIDQQSPMFRQTSNMAKSFVKGVSLGWLGPAVAVYADADPFWRELAETPRDERDEFLKKEVGRMPVAVHAEVANGFQLTAFLTGLRVFIEQTTPGMTVWEPLTYREEPYVKVAPSEKAKSRGRGPHDWALYYAASGEGLTVTPNEKLLHRALDRRIARREAKDQGKPLAPPRRPWLGSNLALEVDRSVLDLINSLNSERYQQAMQARSWGNLPILNEWRRLYPDRDPVKLHEQVWGIRLVCPGGGEYVWNDQWRTMESTVYGHPGRLQPGPVAPPVLESFAHGSFGISFQDGGLRAKVGLERRK